MGEEGIVSFTRNINCDLLFEAYSWGIFPWPSGECNPIPWVCPKQRGVLEFNRLHISRSLQKIRRNLEEKWQFTFNQCFDEVMKQCAQRERPGQSGTWISQKLQKAYLQFHQMGYAHSVECWNKDQKLMGGLYGTFVGGVFSGESMFYLEPSASKLCLLHLIDFLKQRQVMWMDIQMLTPHLEALGGRLIPKALFLQWLKESQLRVKKRGGSLWDQKN